jgi:glucokinase
LRAPLRSTDLATRQAASAPEMLREFLGDTPVDAASIAVAGAIIDGAASGSNLPWPVSETELAGALGIPVRLLNDLEATAIGLLELAPSDHTSLLEGERELHGPIGVIAPGTGLGQAMLVWGDERYLPVASEAGHIDFAPGDELQADYWRYLHRRFGHVSLERACSGGSFRYLVEFLVESDRAVPDEEVSAALGRDRDPTPAILEAGLADRCPACALAIEIFVSMLGAAAGNLALQIVATGGIYLAGGIPPRLHAALREPHFAEAFTSKGRFTGLMRRIPVDLVTETRCGLYGAASDGLRRGSIA